MTGRKTHPTLRLLSVLILCWAGTVNQEIHACAADQARQATFFSSRNTHRLVVMAHKDDGSVDAEMTRLKNWMDTNATGINIILERLDIDQPGIEWELDYAVPSAPPNPPVTVLVGEDKVAHRKFLIDVWESWPGDQDLEILATSPVREAIKRNVVTKWGVLLFAPGTGPEAGETEPEIQKTLQTWATKAPPGLTLIRLDRTAPEERILTSFIGLPAEGPDWVGLIFAKGKIMVPPLEGGAITEANLDQMIDGLMQPCTCMRRPESLGVDIPLNWESRFDDMFVSLDGPEDTVQLAEQARQEELDAIMQGSDRSPLLFAALSALGLMALIILSVTGFAVIRRRRRDTRVSASDDPR